MSEFLSYVLESFINSQQFSVLQNRSVQCSLYLIFAEGQQLQLQLLKGTLLYECTKKYLSCITLDKPFNFMVPELPIYKKKNNTVFFLSLCVCLVCLVFKLFRAEPVSHFLHIQHLAKWNRSQLVTAIEINRGKTGAKCRFELLV